MFLLYAAALACVSAQGTRTEENRKSCFSMVFSCSGCFFVLLAYLLRGQGVPGVGLLLAVAKAGLHRRALALWTLLSEPWPILKTGGSSQWLGGVNAAPKGGKPGGPVVHAHFWYVFVKSNGRENGFFSSPKRFFVVKRLGFDPKPKNNYIYIYIRTLGKVVLLRLAAWFDASLRRSTF